MELLLRVGAVLVALLILSTFLLSLARTALVNRRSRDPLLRLVTRAVHAIVRLLARDRKSDDAVARAGAWFMPLFVIGLILTWFVVVLIGFAMLFWATNAEHGIGDSLVASGSALSTLGFDTPSNRQGQWIAIVEGAFGLGIVVFLFGFIPGYQSTIQTRELRTAWLYARVGPAPSGIDILLWLERNTPAASRDDFWAIWEDWFRQMRATHVLAPEVIYTPSAFPNQSWVTCSHAILDAAAIYVAAVEDRPAATPQLCVTTGTTAIRAVSITLGLQPDSGLGQTALVSEHEFVRGLERLRAAGVTVKPDTVATWERFATMHAAYAPPLHYIAHQTLTPDFPEFLAAARNDRQ